MAKHISYKIVFKNTTPKTIYDLYMNAKKHTMIVGGPVKISTKQGDAFSAHGGYITGSNVKLVKDKMIVQTWRAMNWDKSDADSIFIVTLEAKGKDVLMEAVHANIPDAHVAGVEKGWTAHYWNPWKQHIAGKPITRPTM